MKKEINPFFDIKTDWIWAAEGLALDPVSPTFRMHKNRVGQWSPFKNPLSSVEISWRAMIDSKFNLCDVNRVEMAAARRLAKLNGSSGIIFLKK